MSEFERIKEEAKKDVITISRDEFLKIAAEQTAPGTKMVELFEKQPVLTLLHMLMVVDLADALFRKKEEEKENEE